MLAGMNEYDRECGYSRFTVGEPLAGEGGPLQRVCDDDVVEIWRVFFPGGRREYGINAVDKRIAHHVLYSWMREMR